MNIKIVHLLTHPNEKREINSVSSINKLDLPYVQHINKVFSGKIPKSKWKDIEKNKVNKGRLAEWYKEATYGCFDSHKKALSEFDVDYLMVCECDCIISVPPKQFVDILPFYIKDMEENDIACLAIGSFCNAIKKETKEMYICERIICTQCMLYSSKHKEMILKSFQDEDWYAYDVWLSRVLGKKGKLAVVKQRTTHQHIGRSLIDGVKKRMTKKIDANNGLRDCFSLWFTE